jgi:hypothetical protein
MRFLIQNLRHSQRPLPRPQVIRLAPQALDAEHSKQQLSTSWFRPGNGNDLLVSFGIVANFNELSGGACLWALLGDPPPEKALTLGEKCALLLSL